MQVDVLERWRNTHVLIIDEISMLNADTFDLLHNLAWKTNQCNDELCGGIQVITCGDFRQLPPVKGDYVFKSAIWKKYMFNVIELNESFRQENIEIFNALNEIRIGKVSDKTVDLIMTRHFEVDHSINPNYIRLFFTNMEVDFNNSCQLMNIPSDEHWFHSKDVIKNSKINPIFQIPFCINNKIGAVVMLVKNINVEEGLCNGTIGVVSFVETDGVWVIINGKKLKIENVREDILDCTHNIIASRIGLSLQLAFSLTVHRVRVRANNN
ncbi:ATP-dependent DNA helicase PIF1-like [Hydra vulgaris]|uniref:ATP-dependent DNA helicase PIF1-like n=1 Tax=Hydra vulgaris TaxID=6087 RepID=UPI0032EA81C9